MEFVSIFFPLFMILLPDGAILFLQILTFWELVKKIMTKYYHVSLTNSMSKAIQEF